MSNGPPDSKSLDAIAVDEAALPAAPDEFDTNEEISLLEAQARFWHERAKDLSDLRGLRKKYAGRVFGFMVGWSVVVALFVLVQGFSIWGFELTTPVLVTIVGGTTVSVIGLVLAIIRGLFPSTVPVDPPG